MLCCFFFFLMQGDTLTFLFVVGSLSSTACSASLAKDLAPKSVRKIRKRRPLIRLLLLRCSKDAPYSGAICSLIFEEAVSIPTAPENVAGAPGFLLLTLFLCTYDSQVNSRPRKTMRWVSLVLDASPLSFPLRLKHTNKQTERQSALSHWLSVYPWEGSSVIFLGVASHVGEARRHTHTDPRRDEGSGV